MSFRPKLDDLLQDSLESLSLPDVYLRLREIMESDDASMADAAEVLSLDPALSARVLRLANSAFYGFPSRVDTVTRAASILGMQKIHDLALAICVSSAISRLHNDLMDLNTFWYRSVHCGFLARQIAAGAGLRNAESLFTRGLLHDIGHLILFMHYPGECRRALAKCDQGMDARLLEEQRLIGTDAMQFAAALATHWQLPSSFIESYAYLTEPDKAEPELMREVAMLNLAIQFSSGLDSDLLLEQVQQRIQQKIWDLAELPPEVGNAALDASSLEMVEAMYRLLSGSMHDAA